MLNFESKTKMLGKRLLLVAGLSALLSGCALDDFTNSDEAFEPYGGSKQHPIKVANGKATVDKCGDWFADVGDTRENTMAANHGCAVQSNIAAMVAYPNDLVRPRKMGNAPAFSRTAAIKGLAGGSAGGGGEAAAAPAAAPKP